jgi:hypothetical protein
MRQMMKFAGVFMATAILCSCASASLVDTWRNPEIRHARLQKVLVVSITKNESRRRVFEDMLVSELSARGINAVSGYTQIGAGERASWNVLEKAMNKVNAQGVLTVQTIKVEQQTTIQPGAVGTYPGYWYPQAYPGWNLPGYYGSMAGYGPAYVSTYDIATMQVNLFDAASGRLIWAATVESSEPENITSVGRELARIVVKSLSRHGLI